MRTLTATAARALLAAGQRLSGEARAGGGSVAGVVGAVGAVQAQDAGAAALGLRARLPGLTAAAVDRALWEERTIVRSWSLRGTLHLLASADHGWVLSLLGPAMLRRNGRRLEQLGVATPEAVEATCAVLADGPATRHEVAAAVRSRGIRVADDPQAPVHLVLAAALHGLVVQVGVRDREALYGLTRDWLAPGPAPPDPAAELARRHVRAHPPSAPEDLAAWSGLPMAEARRGFAAIAGELEEVEVLGRRAWVAPDSEQAGADLRLLPAWDNLLLGHRDRALVNPRGLDVASAGMVRPTVVVGAEVRGTWRLVRGAPRAEPAGEVDAGALAAELADVERFRAG